jgi:hypothetical protein
VVDSFEESHATLRENARYLNLNALIDHVRLVNRQNSCPRHSIVDQLAEAQPVAPTMTGRSLPGSVSHRTSDRMPAGHFY